MSIMDANLGSPVDGWPKTNCLGCSGGLGTGGDGPLCPEPLAKESVSIEADAGIVKP